MSLLLLFKFWQFWQSPPLFNPIKTGGGLSLAMLHQGILTRLPCTGVSRAPALDFSPE